MFFYLLVKTENYDDANSKSLFVRKTSVCLRVGFLRLCVCRYVGFLDDLSKVTYREIVYKCRILGICGLSIHNTDQDNPLVFQKLTN